MNRSLRMHIEAPDGRRYRGRWPQQMPATGEGPYIAALARAVGGACEVVLPVGRADVANDEFIFEVEAATAWRKGARQCLAYAQQTGLRPALALFGETDYLPIFLYLRDRVKVIDLWVWRPGRRWERTTSRVKATIRSVGEEPLPPDVVSPTAFIPARARGRPKPPAPEAA